MEEELIYQIKNNPYVYRLLREESIHYRYLYRDSNYFKRLYSIANNKYNNISDFLDKVKNNLDLIKAFMSVIE